MTLENDVVASFLPEKVMETRANSVEHYVKATKECKR